VNSVCIGPEFTTDPASGALIVRNTQSQSWPYTSCTAAAASGLRKDPAGGLWVDPINPAAWHDNSALNPATPLVLNQYTSTGIPELTVTNPSSCLPMQLVLWHNFRAHGTLPLHTYVVMKLWVAPDTVTRPGDASLYTYDSAQCWTDGAAEFAISATLVRRLGLAPGASVGLSRYMSLYAANTASGGSAVPSLIDGGVETTGFGYTQLGPVTDVIT